MSVFSIRYFAILDHYKGDGNRLRREMELRALKNDIIKTLQHHSRVDSELTNLLDNLAKQ